MLFLQTVLITLLIRSISFNFGGIHTARVWLTGPRIHPSSLRISHSFNLRIKFLIIKCSIHNLPVSFSSYTSFIELLIKTPFIIIIGVILEGMRVQTPTFGKGDGPNFWSGGSSPHAMTTENLVHDENDHFCVKMH